MHIIISYIIIDGQIRINFEVMWSYRNHKVNSDNSIIVTDETENYKVKKTLMYKRLFKD